MHEREGSKSYNSKMVDEVHRLFVWGVGCSGGGGEGCMFLWWGVG